MKRGIRSIVLSEHDRVRLRKFQQQHELRLGVSVGLPQLRAAMEAPFSWETLQRALHGEPIAASSYEFVLAFLDRHMPERRRTTIDYKSRAAGEIADPVDEELEKTAAARTVRGSR